MDDLWAFSLDSQTWDSLPQVNTKPSSRFGHTSIYIPSQDKMIIFGGQGITTMNAETWVYDGVSSFLDNIPDRENSFLSLKCFPNPNDGKFNLHFSLLEKSLVNIQLYESNGKNISTILGKVLPAGKHEISYDANHIAPGIYLCVVKTKYYTETIRITLIKPE